MDRTRVEYVFVQCGQLQWSFETRRGCKFGNSNTLLLDQEKLSYPNVLYAQLYPFLQKLIENLKRFYTSVSLLRAIEFLYC